MYTILIFRDLNDRQKWQIPMAKDLVNFCISANPPFPNQQMIQSHQPVNQPVAQVGISVEPINVLQGLQQGIIEEDKELVPKFVDFTQKMVQSL